MCLFKVGFVGDFVVILFIVRCRWFVNGVDLCFVFVLGVEKVVFIMYEVFLGEVFGKFNVYDGSDI